MSDPAAYDPPPSPPPPSYEISQTEFDQKTSRVLEQSAAEPPQPRVDEDGFEIWDDALFEAALAGMDNLTLSSKSQGTSSQAQAHAHHARTSSASGSSSFASSSSAPAFAPSHPGLTSSGFPQEKAKQRQQLPVPVQTAGEASGSGSFVASPPPLSLSPPQVVQSSPHAVPSLPQAQEAHSSPAGIRPLRVAKKSRPRKERPAWYAEAGLGGNSPPPSPLTSEASSSSSGRQPPLRRQLTVFNHTEREGTPPPEFSAIGPPLDGPPYETVLMPYEGTPPPPPSALEPPAFEPLPPPVPPASSTTPQPRASATPVPRPDSARPHPAHSQSLPQKPVTPTPRPHALHHQSMPAVPHHGTGLRTSLFEPGGKLHNAPRLSFNPQMAYAKPVAPAMPAFAADTEPQVANPSAFYSHAVSAHYSFNVPARMRRPTQSEQPAGSHSQYAAQPTGMAAMSGHSGYGAPDNAVAPVASPRPSYAYGQANFQEPAHNMGAAWGPSAQQGWPAGGSSSSSVYRLG